jgi:hypothetical protein
MKGACSSAVRAGVYDCINRIMFYTIYKTTNLINNKFYIGKHQTANPNDSYYGSGKAIKEAILKYGKENFQKEILFIFQTEEEMNAKERELITEEFVNCKDTYNMGVGGEGGSHFKGKKHSIEVRKKISESNISRDYSSLKGKIPWNKGKKDDDSTREKKKKAASNRDKLSDDRKNKISESLKKFNKENPNYQRNSKKRVRKPLSEETKQKLRDRQKDFWKNKKACNSIG